MLRKKIDDKIKILLENGINTHERVMFIIVGDHGRDQISNLHTFYMRLNPGKKLNILWCYKKELGFSNHAKKKMRKIKKLMNKGVFDLNDENAFDLFISSTDIKYCFYHDTQRILGNTFGMLVLQDFEAITPNLLCRTIETVQGGGIIVFLFNNMTSLKQLYTISMDVHDRYRTDANKDIEPRFNERFILSLGSCKNCIVLDDELNILPISSHIKNIAPVLKDFDPSLENAFLSVREKELSSLQASLKDKPPIGNLVNLCKTLDQAKAVMAMLDSISEKSMKSTVSITAARGRGKSAAMGLAISSAIVFGFSNIFVTAPSPENLKTFFEFVVKGLNSLNYREHKDYDIQEGTTEMFKNCVIKINIHKDHKQSISYVLPTNFSVIQMAELLVIDEAAAIPLHIVKRIMPECLIFMASTIQGYEGTGRSLSIKLINQLKQKSENVSSGSRLLKEVKLVQAIRYADNDPIENWLNRFLLLDATEADPIQEGFPEPGKLELYMVNRDTLFSYHKPSEVFLKKIMSLFVSSHYKNSPNDLQLLSDAPAHSIFVLCRSIDTGEKEKRLPDVYAAIQVSEEGGIDKNVILSNSKRGFKPSGDLIPWTISENFQDNEFPHMTGVRVVRIATHPDCQRMGYGTRALELLSQFYEGKMIDPEEGNKIESTLKKATVQSDELKPKKKVKPLLSKLSDIKPNMIYYIGTAFGLTKELFGFWSKNEFHPVYLKLAENDITGEHSCIMIKPIREGNVQTFDINEDSKKIKWINPFLSDFKKRFVTLLGFEFRDLSIKLALSILDPKVTSSTSAEETEDDVNNNLDHFNFINKNQLDLMISNYDFKRLQMYTKNLVKYQMVIDLVPVLAQLFFTKRFGEVSLSYIQAGILLGFGLQYKPFDHIGEEFAIQNSQLLAMFNKMIKKFTSAIKVIYEREEKIITIPQDEVVLDLHEAPNIKQDEKRKSMQDKFSKLNSGIQLSKKRSRGMNS